MQRVLTSDLQRKYEAIKKETLSCPPVPVPDEANVPSPSSPDKETLDATLTESALTLASHCQNRIMNDASFAELKELQAMTNIITTLRSAFFPKPSVVVNNALQINTERLSLFKKALINDC